MKKIIVTGGSGFIGTNFIYQQLSCTNNKVLNFDKLTYAGNIENHADNQKNKNYSFLHGDISDKNKIKKAFKTFEPDVLVNFAAETHVDRSIDNPNIFAKTNFLGTLTLLNASLEWFKTNRSFIFLQISTDEVFGSLTAQDAPFTEDNTYKPNSPYSASKAGSDFLVRAWNKTYNLPTLISNCSNNYGPYQFPEKLIPLVIANCLDEKPIPIYGDGQNIRDWLFVEDHCKALDGIINNGNIGETYNIGGNNEITNIDIVTTICEYLDKLSPRKGGDSYRRLIKFVDDRPGHDFRYAINSSKIKKDLGWKPEVVFKDGILKTIEWYLNNEEWWRTIQEYKYNQERLGLKT